MHLASFRWKLLFFDKIILFTSRKKKKVEVMIK
jgi:hypothetical protein